MFASEMTYDDLYADLSSTFEDFTPNELERALTDLGMVGDIAQEEARNRGWVFERTIEHGAEMTSVSLSVTSFGDDDDESGDED